MKTAIEIKKLTKQYWQAKEPAVDHISFSVDDGEFFAFLGPNGAGKTTTISILTTTLSKTSGEVKVAGYDVEKQAKYVRENIGIIFQSPSLDPHLSAEENIRLHACLYGICNYRPLFCLMPVAYKRRVRELAEIVGLKDALFKPVSKLSGGMQRKLEIMRCLIHMPKILFLDEPTQGLDAMSRRSLWEYIDGVRRENDTTVFLTTHYIDEAEHVDKVCIINEGRIVISGSPEEMKQSLLRQELVIDTDDAGSRERLVTELADMGLSHRIEDHIIVPYQNQYQDQHMTAQEIIARLQTRLTFLRIKEPSLEDAYVEYLRKTGGGAA